MSNLPARHIPTDANLGHLRRMISRRIGHGEDLRPNRDDALRAASATLGQLVTPCGYPAAHEFDGSCDILVTASLAGVESADPDSRSRKAATVCRWQSAPEKIRTPNLLIRSQKRPIPGCVAASRKLHLNCANRRTMSRTDARCVARVVTRP
jgi:hypothetical protein